MSPRIAVFQLVAHRLAVLQADPVGVVDVDTQHGGAGGARVLDADALEAHRLHRRAHQLHEF
jgi:hypothetical protein